MKNDTYSSRSGQPLAPIRRNRLPFFVAAATLVFVVSLHGQLPPAAPVWAADDEPAGPTSTPLSPEELQAVSRDDTIQQDAADGSPAVDSLNLFQLLLKGRWLMIPIGVMSLIVVTVGFDRALALRQHRIFPGKLVAELGELERDGKGFDPRAAYRVCQAHPSAASTVVRTMLLKVGRPQSEIEHAVREVSDREAEKLYGNVRWLNLAAGVTPLLGLLGTVWGMIQAFFDTTQLAPTQNKADFLAEGIYVALVTTLGGLSVAIPAAILAHYFEGRIQLIFHRIDEMLFNLLPQVERFEGRMRVTHRRLEGDEPSQMVAHTQSPMPD